MTTTWWNSNYSIRRQLTVSDPEGLDIESGSQAHIVLPYNFLISLRKIRSDFGDFEVLYWDDQLATPSWTVLAKDITFDYDADTATIRFNTVNDIVESDSNYYIYYDNYKLRQIPIHPTYTSAQFKIRIDPIDGLNLTFTRPQEDWKDGLSYRRDARVAFRFRGKSVRLAVETGPDRGIAQIKIDDEDPTYVDTYAISTTSNQIIYTRTDLTDEYHYLRLLVTGDMSPSSSDYPIKIDYFEYSRYIEPTLGDEEFNPQLATIMRPSTY